MGFTTSRTLDPSGGHDTKLELSMALSRKMCDIERKKRIESKKENWVATDRLRDDIRYHDVNINSSILVFQFCKHA